MKAALIENLITAHCSGDEHRFADALQELVEDETQKGNTPTAARLRKAYTQKRDSPQSSEPRHFFNSSALSSTPTMAAPRDKDSLLELYEVLRPSASLDDVVLPDSQKQALAQFIVEQEQAETLLKHNIPPANRILLCGPPGCGKTLTAMAISNALHLPMAYVRLDGLVSSYLGQTSTNLRKVFDSVRSQRVVLFLDEFDAIAKKRDDAHELGELKRVVTTLLQNFDNLPANVILLAATNHEQLLDPAIWRRFNFTLRLTPPSLPQRKQLIEKELAKYHVGSKVNATTLAKITDGMSGARIDELIREAAKSYLLKGSISTPDIVKLLIKQQTHFSESSDDSMREICRLLDSGVSLRTAASALGISHSTLEYRVQKYRGMKHDG